LTARSKVDVKLLRGKVYHVAVNEHDGDVGPRSSPLWSRHRASYSSC
jgi:hypothetical protein